LRERDQVVRKVGRELVPDSGIKSRPSAASRLDPGMRD
jgi:hypothetical protein